MASTLKLGTAASSNPTEPSTNIFDLPREIRNLIYALYFGPPIVAIHWNTKRSYYNRRKRTILSVSRRINEEAEEQLYASMKVTIFCAYDHKPHPRLAKVLELVRRLEYIYEQKDYHHLVLMPNLRTLMLPCPLNSPHQSPGRFDEPPHEALLVRARNGVERWLAGIGSLKTELNAHPRIQEVTFTIRCGSIYETRVEGVAEKVTNNPTSVVVKLADHA